MPSLAPIAVFAFKRPRHLQGVLEALDRCDGFADSEVFIYSDGPRGSNDEAGVQAVRDLLRTWQRKNVRIIEQPRNVGLANSIITAVTELTERYGRIIVIEDDLILQPSALRWLNDGLDAYADAGQVMQISAYQYRVPAFAHRTQGNFQHFATTWGWATWQRAWTHFDPVAQDWRQVRENPEVRRAFDAGDVYPFAAMLESQMEGKLDSWGIRWSWSVFRRKGLTLMPPKSLVRNVGFDGSATHNTLGPLKGLASAPPPLDWTDPAPPALPPAIKVDEQDEREFRKALKATNALRNHNIKKILSRIGFSRFKV